MDNDSNSTVTFLSSCVCFCQYKYVISNPYFNGSISEFPVDTLMTGILKLPNLDLDATKFCKFLFLHLYCIIFLLCKNVNALLQIYFLKINLVQVI